MRIVIASLLLTFLAATAIAGKVNVVNVSASQRSDGTWRFSVTLKHADEGWNHYADRWDVVGPDGAVLAERVLLHPHVDEQPFTRSLSGVDIPDDVDAVTIRGHDTVHKLGGVEMTVRLPR